MNGEYEDTYDDAYEIDREPDWDSQTIVRIHQLRHARNIFGADEIARRLGVTAERVRRLCNSAIWGGESANPFLIASDEELERLLGAKEAERQESLRRKAEAEEKNARLIRDLRRQRETFAGIGTNKAKRRLNKLADSDAIAKAVRLAIEIEDVSITAKDAYGKYQDKRYGVKAAFIEELAALFASEQWTWGVQQTERERTPFAPSHVIYFEIPGCAQISWHFNPLPNKQYPDYAGEWDRAEQATLTKLEAATRSLLLTAGLDKP